MTYYRLLGFFITAFIVTYLCKLSFDAGAYSAKTELEIYTLENIYYINGLEVTNESNDHVVTFNSMKALKEYVSDITVKDNK